MSALNHLTEERRMLADSVAGIAGRYGHKYFSDLGRRSGSMSELWQDLGRSGFLGVGIAEEYGGGGGGIYDLVVVLEELAAHGVPLFLGVISPGICGSILTAHGSPEQKSQWLPRIASGETIMAFAITEPDAGSNSHRLKTAARQDGDEWVISGSKTFISGADEAEQIIVVARTGTDDKRRGELTLFLVHADSPGLQRNRIEMELVSPERQFTLFFDDVRVPASAMIGTVGDGLRLVFAGLNPERVTVAALANGIGRYAIDRAADYTRTRQVWDAPIGAHQGVAHPLAQRYIELELSRQAMFRAATLIDEGADASEAANIAKYAAGEAGIAALDQAIQVHGGNGLTSEYGLADLWFVARLMRTAPVSREMVLNFVSQHSLHLPRSY
jgi:alkylation response protein AidB-like acyl-CoA dehydrogenase